MVLAAFVLGLVVSVYGPEVLEGQRTRVMKAVM
jgi:hypothetical protein